MKSSLSGMIIAIVISGVWCAKALAGTNTSVLQVSTIKKGDPAMLVQYRKNESTARVTANNAAIFLRTYKNMPMFSLLDMARIVSALPPR